MFSFCLKYLISDVYIEYKKMTIEENQKKNITYVMFFNILSHYCKLKDYNPKESKLRKFVGVEKT